MVVAGRRTGQPISADLASARLGATVAQVSDDAHQEPSDNPDPAPDTVLAAPAARLMAAIVDSAVLQVAGMALVGVGAGVAIALSTIAYLVYEVAMVASRGQTLGKLALGTAVADGVDGGRPTLWQAATRAVVPLAGVVVDVALGTTLVGALWVFTVYGALLFDDRRRGLHDKAAGTEVVVRQRTEAHRRVGTAAVVVASILTLVTVLIAMNEAAKTTSTRAHGRPAVANAVPR